MPDLAHLFMSRGRDGADTEGLRRLLKGVFFNECVCFSVAQIIVLTNCKCYVSGTSGRVGHTGWVRG